MKPNAVFFVMTCICAMLVSCSQENTIELFNGKDLDNWTIYLEDSSADPNAVFQAQDGIMKVLGTPNGYIKTKESYSNYKLHLEWRWSAEPANSGVLLHIQGEDRLWPNCVECQLMNQRAGDIVLMGENGEITINGSLIKTPAGRRVTVADAFEESSEKPAGEWNVYEITCNVDNIEVIVNGVLQNRGTGLFQSSGQIGLQSEGGPIEFRNIYLEPLE